MNVSMRLRHIFPRQQVACVHTHYHRIVARFDEKHKEKNSREEWLKEHGERGSVSYSKASSESPLGLVTFHHKQRLNAFTGTMMHDFYGAVKEATRDPSTRCIVVRGEGGHFCSGGDLAFVEKIASEEGSYVMNTSMRKSLKRLATSDKVSIAVLEGSTMGGASEIASACDIRVAQRKAKVGFVQGRMGVCPGWGGGRFLVRALGHARATEYLATAAVVGTEELQRIGFINHIFDAEDDLSSYLNRFSSLESKNAFVAAKRMVANYSGNLPEEEKEEEERRIFMSVWGHEDHKKSIQNIKNALAKAKKEKMNKH